MRAIGRIDHVDSRGISSVTMFYGGKWQQGSWKLEGEMPENHPDFGLFEFEPYDQFCKWIDLDKEN
jgi:hypothetical protein